VPLVTMLRTVGPYRKGTTVDVPEVDARSLTSRGHAKVSRAVTPARNAKRDEWARHAAKLGQHVSDDMTRQQIIDLLDRQPAAHTTSSEVGPPTPVSPTETSIPLEEQA
jgi:hypothetical protein